jgi:3-dehydroshikimate dehydratase
MIRTSFGILALALMQTGTALAQTTPAPIAAVAAGGPSDTGPEVTVLRVDRGADDEAQGSLRWAVTTSNADPGRYRIDIVGAPRIVLKSPLPTIKGPVIIEGSAFARDGRHSVIDGSGYLPRDLKSCPGAVQGQYGTNVRTSSFPGLALVDTRGVTLRGLEIRGFCIGVLVLRTSNSVIANNRIVQNIGGAGVMLSGDDGKGGSTSNTTLDNKVLRNLFLENGDGLELTRGAAFNLIADNDFDGGTDNLEQSQGIEILWGNDNTVVRNRFAHYSDGLQLNWGARNYIGANVFRDNAFGVSVTGAGNMIEGNDIQANGVGIAVRPEAKRAVNRISQNLIVGNGLPVMRCSAGGSCDPKLARGGIVMGLPGLEHGDFVGSRGMGVVFDQAGAARVCQTPGVPAGCHEAPQFGLAPPRLVSAKAAGGGVKITGSAEAPADTSLVIEIFANPPGGTEGERYLGTIKAATDAAGKAAFSGEVAAAPRGASITATLTTSGGASSAFSSPVVLGR